MTDTLPVMVHETHDYRCYICGAPAAHIDALTTAVAYMHVEDVADPTYREGYEAARDEVLAILEGEPHDA